MKSLKKIFFYPVMLLTLSAMTWVACKEDVAEELNLSRRFKPAEFDITSGETSATIGWSPSLFTVPGDVEYLVEFAREGSDFAAVEHSVTTTSTELTVMDTDIDIRVNFLARVKAIGKDGVNDSNWLVSAPFQITGEIFILPLAEYDVLVDGARITWQTEDVLTRLVITPQGGTPVEVTITAEEAAAGEKIVSGLSGNTNYTIEIFKGTVSKGSVSFRTKPSYAEANIIDLQVISGNPNVLQDTLPNIPSGSVVLLKRGETYDISSIALNRSVTITSGAEFNPEFATILSSNSFNIEDFSDIDSLVFKDVNITGVDFGGDYAFNINNEGSIGKVKFENVRAHSIRGLFRIQTGDPGAQVQDLIINNCVIDSVRDFAIAWTNNSNIIANIRISNTTIYKARKVIVHNSPGSNSIIIENCTFNEAPTGGVEGAEANYFIDLNGNNTAAGIQITNTIIGRGWNEGAGDYVHGIRTGGATNITVTNSYITSDMLATNPAYQIPGILAYPKASTAIFAAPTSGDFSIIDGAFPGAESAGDARWRE